MDLMDVVVLGLVVTAVGFTVLVLPIWIIAHYLSKSRAENRLTTQDEKLLADLWQAAQRMEERMNNLERIADPEPSKAAVRLRETARG
jgi:phage shock protein B